MADILRLLIAAISWFAISICNVSFLFVKIWPSQAEGIFVPGFETLVITNLAFLLMYIVLKEE